MLASRNRLNRADRLDAVERLKLWTRARFELSRDTTISIAEISCTLPGCPPLETVVTFWIAERQYRFKFFKPMAEVCAEDLPWSWLKDSLEVEDGAAAECC